MLTVLGLVAMQALFPNQPQLTNLWPKKHTETPNCVFLSKALFLPIKHKKAEHFKG
jgi:hypothetical protein